MVDAKLMLKKMLKVWCRYLLPFLSYREDPAGGGGAESAPPAGRVNPRPHLVFRKRRPHLGGHPLLVCPLVEIELHNKDKRKHRDVLNPTTPDFSTLTNILTFPRQVKQKKCCFFGIGRFHEGLCLPKLSKCSESFRKFRISVV